MIHPKIVITGIAYREIPDGVYRFQDLKMTDELVDFKYSGECPKTQTFDVQEIRTKKFTLHDREVWLCWTPDIAETLGVAMGVYDEMNGHIDMLHNSRQRALDDVEYYENKIFEYRNAGFFKRLKYLITGFI